MFNDRKRRYLLLIPVFFLIFNAYYFKSAAKAINNALLSEKYDEVVHFVDMLTVVIDANVSTGGRRYEIFIKDSTEYIDQIPQIYAGAYKLIDGELLLISERYNDEETIFDPFMYPEFSDEVLIHDSGGAVVYFEPENEPSMEIHLYYKWMPTIPDAPDLYLVIAGVSKYSVTAKIALWVSVGQWVSTIITFGLQTWLVVMLAYLGDIYNIRRTRREN